MLFRGRLTLYALMAGMVALTRLKLVLLVVLTMAFAVEPTLHNHPLIPAAGDAAVSPLANSCPACTVSTARLALTAPAVTAPTVVAYVLPALTEAAPAKPSALPRASRAPPTAV
ncbi:MAG: hypothetical protein JWO56_3343 [Acidobacteria bacterium]|nr:hypothetical protein [Acidobacteriota bacterium]